MLKNLIALLIGGIVLMTGLDAQGISMGYTQITQEEAFKIMNTRNDIIILDVRTLEEYKESHIPGAICIPVETIGQYRPALLSDTSQTILVYCRSGRRSKQAAEALSKLGYTDILEFGGIITWKYEVTR